MSIEALRERVAIALFTHDGIGASEYRPTWETLREDYRVEWLGAADAVLSELGPELAPKSAPSASTVDRIRAVFRQACLYNHAADDLLCERLAEAVKPQGEPVGVGFVIAPHYRGYAHLGTGRYRLFHSCAGDAAELSIVPATPEEIAGRKVGDLRDDGPEVIDAESMAVRIRFENVAGLDALEQQLRLLREVHFPSPFAAPQPQAEPVAWQTRYKMRNGQWSDWQTRADRHDANSNLAFYSSRNTEAQVRGLYPIPGADND